MDPIDIHCIFSTLYKSMEPIIMCLSFNILQSILIYAQQK